MTPTRLFDFLDWQLQKFPQEDMLAAKENGVWRKYSTQEIKQLADSMSMGLLKAGVGYQDGSIEGRDKVAVLSNNRPEWLILDLAVQQTGAVLTPIYPTISVNELEFILNDAGVKVILLADAELKDKIESIRANVPSLTHVFTFNEIQNADHLSKLIKLGKDNPQTEQLKEYNDHLVS